jgi:hypothetical protein
VAGVHAAVVEGMWGGDDLNRRDLGEELRAALARPANLDVRCAQRQRGGDGNMKDRAVRGETGALACLLTARR